MARSSICPGTVWPKCRARMIHPFDRCSAHVFSLIASLLFLFSLSSSLSFSHAGALFSRAPVSSIFSDNWSSDKIVANEIVLLAFSSASSSSSLLFSSLRETGARVLSPFKRSQKFSAALPLSLFSLHSWPPFFFLSIECFSFSSIDRVIKCFNARCSARGKFELGRDRLI